MSTIQLFLKQMFNNSWPSMLLMLTFNAVGGFIVFNWEVHIIFKVILLLALLYKSFLVHITNSITPGGVHDYSWKYLQSLPLNKKQILASITIGEFISTMILISWIVAFYPTLYDLFADEKPTWNIFFKQMSWLLILVFGLCLSGVKSQIENPRKLFSAQDPKAKYYHYLKSILIMILLGMYSFLAIRYWSQVTESKYDEKIELVFDFLGTTIKSWWMPPILLALSIWSYFSALKTWQDERISYKKLTWINKEQWPQVGVLILVLFFGYFTFDFTTPLDYSEDKFLTAIHKEDYPQIENELASINTDYKSKHNLSPLFVAALNGNWEMYQYLLKKGFIPDLSENQKKNSSHYNWNVIHAAIVGKNNLIFSDLLNRNLDIHAKPKAKNTYLQFAAMYCKPNMLDELISKKVKTDEANEDGNTALHLAAYNNCFGAVVSLIEAGADPMIKNKKGTLANDYIKPRKSKSDLAYYLAKKTRAPASKK